MTARRILTRNRSPISRLRGPGDSALVRRVMDRSRMTAAPTIYTLPTSGLIVAWEARSSLNTLDVNGDAEVLYDLAGNGNHGAVTGGVGDRPALGTAADFGDQIVATCDGTAGEAWSLATFAGGALAQPNTVYWLGKQVNAGATRLVVDSGTQTARHIIQKVTGSWTAASITNLTCADTSLTAIVVCGIFDATSGSIFVNDMGTAAATGPTGNHLMNGLCVARSWNGTIYSQTFGGAYVYSEAHTQTQREAVISYLIQEFGVGTAP